MSIPRPALQSKWWTVAPPPDLTAEGLQPESIADGRHANEPNDHSFFKASDGRWHLWACVRNTGIGRLFCHWSAESLTDTDWKRHDEVIRCDRDFGESRVEYRGQEFLQSPYVVFDEGVYYMFYGGYDTGWDRQGNPTTDYNLQEKQLCLMTSPDGLNWTRFRSAEGFSRVFWGPGAVRDPMIGRFRGKWHAYYAGHHDQDRTQAGIYARTSEDLIHWSDWTLAHFDPTPGRAGRPVIHESPFVVEHGGRYYLFRTHGVEPGTHVFVSDDPLEFGTTPQDCADRHVHTFSDIVAPELITDDDGTQYISRINSPEGYRIQLARMTWD